MIYEKYRIVEHPRIMLFFEIGIFLSTQTVIFVPMKALNRYIAFLLFMLLATGVFAQDNKPAFRVAPNPADDYIELFFEADNATPSLIRVFDLIGNQVSTMNVPANNTHPIKIETSTLKPGVYFLSVYTTSGRIETLKFLKAR